MCLKIWCIICEGASNRVHAAIGIRDIDLFLIRPPVIGRGREVYAEVARRIAENVV